MTLTDVLKDFAYLSVLLLVGFELRRRIVLFQRFFIPTSLIAGTIGMFLSQGWLGEVAPVYIPFSAGIGQWSGVLVIVVCATMFLGRVGPLSFGVSILMRAKTAGTIFPQGRMLIG